MNEFKIGDEIWSGYFALEHGTIIDSLRCGSNRIDPFLDSYNSDYFRFKTKNEAIDAMIKVLESMKDQIIRIERRKCPKCDTPFSDIAGLVSTPDGEEWHMTCNNRDCDYVLVKKVKRQIEVIE